MLGLQQALGCDPNPFLEHLQQDLFQPYDQISSMEKSIWAQRARVCNYLYRYLDTRYFHMLVKIRKAKRSATRLKDEHDNWVVDHVSLTDLVFQYFSKFFQTVGSTTSRPFDAHLACGFSKIRPS